MKNDDQVLEEEKVAQTERKRLPKNQNQTESKDFTSPQNKLSLKEKTLKHFHQENSKGLKNKKTNHF